MLAILEDLLAVHKYVQHTGCVLVRLNEGSVILDRIWIEDNHVCEESFLQLTTPVEPKILARCFPSEEVGLFSGLG